MDYTSNVDLDLKIRTEYLTSFCILWDYTSNVDLKIRAEYLTSFCILWDYTSNVDLKIRAYLTSFCICGTIHQFLYPVGLYI